MRLMFIVAATMAAAPALADALDDVREKTIKAAEAWDAAVSACLSTSGEDLAGCRKALSPAAARLEATNAKLNAGGGSPKPSPQSTPAVPDVASTKPATVEARKLSRADLGVETSKWNGKTVEATLQCFYADKDEFRCTAGSGRIDFSDLSPADEREKLEHDCDTIANMDKQLCRRTIRFVYGRSESREVGGLMGKMTLVHPQGYKGEIIAGAKRR